MKTRNALNVLASIIDWFPVYKRIAQLIEAPIQKLAEDNNRSDLQLLARR